MQQLTPAPISCCRPCCRDSVIVVNAGSSGVNADLWGEEDPNESGVTPANTALWGKYHQVTATGEQFTEWEWNPDMSPQRWS